MVEKGKKLNRREVLKKMMDWAAVAATTVVQKAGKFDAVISAGTGLLAAEKTQELDTHTNRMSEYFRSITKLPEGVGNALAPYIPGIVMQESSFNAKQVSKDGAVGFYQMTDIAIKDLLKFKYLDGDPTSENIRRIKQKLQEGDFAYNTEVFSREIELAYARMKRTEMLSDLKEFFPMLSRSEFNKLVAYLLINIHHSGFSTIRAVVRNLIESVGDDSAIGVESAIEAFNIIRKHGREVYKKIQISFDDKNEYYGKDAYQYVAKVAQWAEELKRQEKGEYINEWQKRAEVPEVGRFDGTIFFTVAAAVLGVLKLSDAKHAIENRDEKNTLWLKSRKYMKKTFLAATLAGATFAALDRDWFVEYLPEDVLYKIGISSQAAHNIDMNNINYTFDK